MIKQELSNSELVYARLNADGSHLSCNLSGASLTAEKIPPDRGFGNVPCRANCFFTNSHEWWSNWKNVLPRKVCIIIVRLMTHNSDCKFSILSNLQTNWLKHTFLGITFFFTEKIMLQLVPLFSYMKSSKGTNHPELIVLSQWRGTFFVRYGLLTLVNVKKVLFLFFLFCSQVSWFLNDVAALSCTWNTRGKQAGL